MQITPDSESRIIQRKPGLLIWQGTPSDHSGAYHVILSLGIDGVPVKVGIENADSFRLEIPGLLDSGWDPLPDAVVKKFFTSAKTCRPMQGVYFNQERVSLITDVEDKLHAYCPDLAAFFKDPQTQPQDLESCEYSSLLIFSQIENHTETSYYCDFIDDPESIEMDQLRDRFIQIRQFMDAGSEGFIQFVVSEDRLRVDGLTDLFCWWLWDTTTVFSRMISDG